MLNAQGGEARGFSWERKAFWDSLGELRRMVQANTVLSIHGAGDFNLLANTPNNLQILTEHQVFKRYVNERVTDGPRPLSVGLESRNWIIVVIFCQNLYKASSKRSLSSRAKQKDEQRRTEFQHTMTELSRNVYRKSYKAYFVWSNEL